MTATAYAHIELRPDGVPTIAGTRTKVILLVADWHEAGEDVTAIRRAYPDLSPGQIYSALAYYYDHKDALDDEIARRRSRAESLRGQFEAPSFLARLGVRPRE
jgi:uncharacterized protein (DUF433 family)